MARRYGPQGWWPVARPGGRRARYDPRWTAGPLAPPQMFEMAVGAFLTQNTAWVQASRAVENLRGAGLLEARALRAAPPARLHALLRPAGFFRQKTRRLRGFARFLLDRWGGRLDRFLARPLEEASAALQALDGVGPETADSILLYAGGRPVFVVDAYTRRIAHRLRLFRYNTTDMIQAYFHRALPRRAPLYREAHALLVAHAKTHCRAVPRCGGCPLRGRCPSALHE